MFSVQNDDPFIIFQHLQDIARKECGESSVIDLSRGDPGFGFVPSVRGRECASFVLWLDTVLNSDAGHRLILRNRSECAALKQQITQVAQATYAPEVASRLVEALQEVIDFSLEAAQHEGKQWDEWDVLSELFGYSAMSGGSYLNPHGQELTRVITAAWHRREYGVDVQSSDLILTSGASHAIGTLFKALGEEGCGFLRTGDAVAIASPVYSPYNRILEERGLTPFSYSIDPLTGAMGALPKGTKALILIDPNNPTGFSLSHKALVSLAQSAKEQNLLVITDEVYFSFFPSKHTMLSLAPERTICINSRSKIERSTGLREGEIIILPKGKEHIAKMLGLEGATAFERLLLFAKAPGRTGGQFQHTTFVPGPAQLLGITHIVLGTAERKQYVHSLRKNQEVFCTELALPHKGNLYYVIFDLNQIPGCNSQHQTIEERLVALAKAGVVLIPAHRFFAETDRSKATLTLVRASVVNTTQERLRRAAKIIRKEES